MGLSEHIEEIITTAGARHQLMRALPRHPNLFLVALLDKHRTNLALARFQLIEVERALAIQRRMTWRFGRRSACGTLVDSPSAAKIAGCAPAELQACDLSAGRSLALVLGAREVATGRVDLASADHESGWRRLDRIREIGPWTLQKLAFHGQGRDDQLPAGDLAYIKLVGRLAGLGRRATVDEVTEWFEPYAPYQGLAGLYLVVGGHGLTAGKPPATVRGGYPVTRPLRAGARW